MKLLTAFFLLSLFSSSHAATQGGGAHLLPGVVRALGSVTTEYPLQVSCPEGVATLERIRARRIAQMTAAALPPDAKARGDIAKGLRGKGFVTTAAIVEKEKASFEDIVGRLFAAFAGPSENDLVPFAVKEGAEKALEALGLAVLKTNAFAAAKASSSPELRYLALRIGVKVVPPKARYQLVERPEGLVTAVKSRLNAVPGVTLAYPYARETVRLWQKAEGKKLEAHADLARRLLNFESEIARMRLRGDDELIPHATNKLEEVRAELLQSTQALNESFGQGFSAIEWANLPLILVRNTLAEAGLQSDSFTVNPHSREAEFRVPLRQVLRRGEDDLPSVVFCRELGTPETLTSSRIVLREGNLLLQTAGGWVLLSGAP